MSRVLLLFALLLFATNALAGGKVMTSSSAKNKAIAILMGDPYGNDKKEVAKHITSVTLLKKGTDECGGIFVPVYQVKVFVPAEDQKQGDSPIEGNLYIDARTGSMLCAGLPFLD